MEVLWIIAGVIILWSAISGWRDGVVRRVVELVGLIAIFLFASGLATAIRPWLADRLHVDEKIVFVLSWGVVLLGGLLLVRLVAIAAQKLVRFSLVAWLDRGGGLVLGVAFGALLVSCVFIGALALPLGDDLHDDLLDDPYASALLRLAPDLYDSVRGLWDGGEFFENLGDRLEPAARKAVEKIEAAIEESRAPGS